MKSFGSSLYKAGDSTNKLNNVNTSIKDIIISSFKNALNTGLAGNNSDEDIQGELKNNYNLTLNTEQVEDLLNDNKVNYSTIYTSKYNESTDFIEKSNYLSTKEDIFYEDQFKLPGEILNIFNNYKYIYKKAIDVKRAIGVVSGKSVKQDERLLVALYSVIGSPSLFNPLFSINANGITANVPLLNTKFNKIRSTTAMAGRVEGKNGEKNIESKNLTVKQKYLDYNIQDCSIKTLVNASQINLTGEPNNRLEFVADMLGLARYRYSDFMFCKDLGKISNNHLITLRRFAHPVSDNIFKGANYTLARNAEEKDKLMEQEPDLARLVAWFGTGDNKLEDIMNYNYSMSWRELKAEIQEMQSQEDNHKTLLGSFVNSINGDYNDYQAKGFTGNNNVISSLAGRSTGIFAKGFGQDGYQDQTILRNYDKNKVYEPKNTIQDTLMYEGKLQFNQEFTLVFSYKMRSYSNINAKSAFLDLIGNILEVTYRRGIFWQGGRKFIGPPQNTTGWKKANGYINNSWDQMTSFGEALMRGNLDIGSIFASASEMVSKAYESAKGNIQEVVGNPKSVGNKLAESISEFYKTTHFGDALKGQLLNTLGRPAIYAWDSLLSGDDVGLWHLTIGNPLNPIAAFGNLVITGASIQHLGPLGIDDFPTELKVTVNLKHARSRDITDIGKMYTKGFSGLYSLSSLRYSSNYFGKEENTKNYIKDEAKRLQYNDDYEKSIKDNTIKKEAKFNEWKKTHQEPKKEDYGEDEEKYKKAQEKWYADYKAAYAKIEDENPVPEYKPKSFSAVSDDSFYGTFGTDDFAKINAQLDEIA